MIRKSFAKDRYVSGENDMIFGKADSWDKSQPKAVLYCHGSGTDAIGVFNSPNQNITLNSFGEWYTTHAGDYGLETWGNDTGVARLQAAIDFLHAEWGQVGKIGIVAASMGMTNALNYARVHPENVAAIAGVIPCLDIANIYALGVPGSTAIDAAYPPTYNDATVGQTHSPIHMVQNGLLDADLPIKIWTVNNDATCLPITATNFVNARPQTPRVDLGALGHTTTAVAAATPQMLAFMRDHL